MTIPCSGIILAGGMNTRFSGKDKAFLEIGNQRIIDRIFKVFLQLFKEIILVTNNPIKFLDWDVKIVSDIFPFRSSLTGIHAGLFYTSNPFSFFSACDTPFLKKELVELLIQNIERNTDVIIPETSEGMEPLSAIYSKHCLKPVTQNLKQNNLQIKEFFSKVRLKKIDHSELQKVDPDLMSFFNINTPQDFEKAQDLLESA